MSNLMHKVKDAVTGHHHSENKDSTHDSSKVMHNTHDASNNTSSNYGTNIHSGSKVHDPMKPGITFVSTPTGTGSYPTTGHSHNPMMGTQMVGTANTHEPTPMGTTKFGPDNHSAGVVHDPKKGPVDVAPTAMSTGGYTTGSHTHGSGHINAGPHDSKLANKLDSRVDSDLDNRGTNGSTQVSTSQPGDHTSAYGTTGTSNAPTTGVYTSNYGRAGDNSLSSHTSPAYNTHSTNTGMGNAMDTRTEPGMTGQGAFSGTVTGGSSYNAPETTSNTTSGPHSSNLLNKLDPRVNSSEHQSSTAGNQRGF